MQKLRIRNILLDMKKHCKPLRKHSICKSPIARPQLRSFIDCESPIAWGKAKRCRTASDLHRFRILNILPDMKRFRGAPLANPQQLAKTQKFRKSRNPNSLLEIKRCPLANPQIACRNIEVSYIANPQYTQFQIHFDPGAGVRVPVPV